MKRFSFLVLITYYYTLNLYKITQNQPDTINNTLISNTYPSNMHILIIYIIKMLEICMYNIVLLYNQLYSYIMIYTNVLFIVHWCTYNTCTFIQNSISLHLALIIHYVCIRVKVKGGGYFILYTHGCTNAIFTSDKTLKEQLTICRFK